MVEWNEIALRDALPPDVRHHYKVTNIEEDRSILVTTPGRLLTDAEMACVGAAVPGQRLYFSAEDRAYGPGILTVSWSRSSSDGPVARDPAWYNATPELDEWVIEEALLSPQPWDKGGHVHNWRTHVGEHTKSIWETFTREQKIAIAGDANDLAHAEIWD